MRRTPPDQFQELGHDTERLLRKEKKKKEAEQQQRTMENQQEPQPLVVVADNRPLREYAVPSIAGLGSSVIRPNIQANNFEIKPIILQMIQNSAQFSALPSEDPNTHIHIFLEICDLFKQNGVSDDAIKLRLFPFSLRDKARVWLNSMPAGTFTS